MHPFRLLVVYLCVASALGAIPAIEQTVRQIGNGFPRTWGVRNGAPVVADYEMDPEIVNDPRYRERLPEGLRALPSLLVTMKNEDLFGEERGIYAHPMESGDDWERACKAELVGTNNVTVFEVDCGIQIQGGWNRRPEESPKHAFRIVFKKRYGPGKLKAAIFGSDAATEFDTFILRAGCNNTWLHWKGEERKRGDFLRDQWARDTQRAMGHLSPRGIFVHLYLNGLYWGLYNLVERPDDSFAETYLGGAKQNYDARNADKILSGDATAWDELFEVANAGVTNIAQYERIAALLDLENFADYMLLNLYGANADWDRASNWYACRPRRAGGKWLFLVWDAERTLEYPKDNRLLVDDDRSPTRLFHRLRQSEDFRKLFAARAEKHLGGVLSAAKAAERYKTLSKEIELAVIGEAARWGDYRRDVHQYKEGPYELYTPETWRREVDRLLTEYFPTRTEIFRAQLKEARLIN
ncbi:MAG TPA: CotH kinase family protein [Methylomirabilota bacterium]|nr:CotH kinase family protein [Methylomirabilota bacterium]